jgi:hypothetical protein
MIHVPFVRPSIQWQAFQRVIRLLRNRGNDVLVILGPFTSTSSPTTNDPLFA